MLIIIRQGMLTERITEQESDLCEEAHRDHDHTKECAKGAIQTICCITKHPRITE